jgi:hypothetical protein
MKRTLSQFATGLALFSFGCAGSADVRSSARADEITGNADDADVMAIRVQQTVELDTALAAQIRTALTAARAAHPEFADVHARPDFALESLLIEAQGGVAAAFAANRLATGVATLDDAFTRYHAVSVAAVFSDFYVVTFGEPLKMNLLVKQLSGAANVSDVEVNGLVGDGNNVTAERGANAWVITFDVGSGDCPAGCISHVKTHVTVGDDGSVN